MMSTATYIIRPGGDIIGLWSDFLSCVPGDKTVNRASNVEYEEKSQSWSVRFTDKRHKDGDRSGFLTRKEALCYEKGYLQRQLKLISTE